MTYDEDGLPEQTEENRGAIAAAYLSHMTTSIDYYAHCMQEDRYASCHDEMVADWEDLVERGILQKKES